MMTNIYIYIYMYIYHPLKIQLAATAEISI